MVWLRSCRVDLDFQQVLIICNKNNNRNTFIKISTKKVKITIPAEHTGKAYGVINQYKENENWLDDGSLEVFVDVPSGAIMNFYDKLNNVTHGSALTEEIKKEEEQE